jgi:hypothetical protein
MFETYFWVAVLAFAALALLNLGFSVFRRATSSVGLASMAATELVAVATLLVAIIQVSLGAEATTSTVEYFFYAIFAVLIPLAGVTWTLIAKNQWAAIVYFIVALTELVMLARMHQIWFG